MQNKLLLVGLPGGGWGRPVHGAPSTHILKIDDAYHPGLVAAEADCLHIARGIGLTTVEAQIADIGGMRWLIVSRYDRRIDADATVGRIHQEDACQALALDPEANRGRGKYQVTGGPSLAAVADLLDRWAGDPDSERRALLAATTFTVAIGNADAHGKNISLIHPTPDTISLAPLYDTVPTVLWPNLRSDAAMTVNGIAPLEKINIEDLIAEGTRWGMSAKQAHLVVVETLGRVSDEARRLDPTTGVSEQVVNRVGKLM